MSICTVVLAYTVSIKIFKHHFKEDGTCNVKIVIYHRGERKYLDTTHYVNKKQINGSSEIKDKFLLKILNGVLDDYRQAISDLGSRLEFFSCEDLKQYLLNKNKEIDFFLFSRDYIARLRKGGTKGTAGNHRNVLVHNSAWLL